jgi:hypothetical protein
MSLVFQNIYPPLRPASVYPRLCWEGRTHSPGGEGGWGVNILEDERHRIISYSDNLSTPGIDESFLIFCGNFATVPFINIPTRLL